MNLSQLQILFAKAGARKLYAKELAVNDNSKNQIYFAGATEALNVFPSRQIFAENTRKGPSFKAQLNFEWLLDSGRTAVAPNAQLILYSQYPEVRFSGFLQGCKESPGLLMMDRTRAKTAPRDVIDQLGGRVLFLGVTSDHRVLGYAAAGNSEIACDFKSRRFPTAVVVFKEVPVPDAPNDNDARSNLLRELRRINSLGWIVSKQLGTDGRLTPCHAPQCGGFTLEAELGIQKNSVAEPDYQGWEVKQHTVSSFSSPLSGSAITLMTPEPTGGFYKDSGVEAFIRKYGYADKLGRPDRLNFGGIHRVTKRQSLTGLRMLLMGYDSKTDSIIDANGAIQLVSDTDEIAASWSFSGLFTHWSRKHTRAVYVPSMKRNDPDLQYSYGGNVRLAQETDALRLLAALSTGTVFYDPGIKLENASTRPVVKRRSQFRIASRDIATLYKKVEQVEV